MGLYRNATRALAAVTAALGVALIVASLAGGGGLGVLLGILFLAAGLGRLYIARGGRR